MTDDDRERGILTPADRDYLRNPDEYSRQASHQREQAIRKRTRDALLDSTVLFENLDEDLRKDIFGVDTGGKSPSERREWAHVEDGAAAFIAFLYLALNERFGGGGGGGFESTLKNAMSRVAEENGWILEDFDFRAEFTRAPDSENLLEKFNAGYASPGEAIYLLRNGYITSEEFAEEVGPGSE